MIFKQKIKISYHIKYICINQAISEQTNKVPSLKEILFFKLFNYVCFKIKLKYLNSNTELQKI